jgi:alanyl-tRNA synthetase
MSSGNDIRASFLEFFRKNGHEVVASSSLVPRNDPTLLFTNAGMVQFKNVFTGVEKREYVRAVTSQKCVRAGGKHNDLENVGYTARHHTFFEMLGNFSFGDYFKERAIELAWTLVTKEYGLSAERLIATVFSEDDDAFGLWRKISSLPESRIIRIPTSDNFWSMGETGPCGPCSEIFYDHGPGIAGGPPGSPEADGDRWVEIWNLVFMQFEQLTKERRVPLPRPSIDTGMGLERLAAVLQGKHDNYDTDLLRPIMEAAAGAVGHGPDGKDRPSFKAIADHLRSSCFLIADGVLPSNEGRGYVLRRIMRRAMRHAHMIGAKDPLMWRLVPALVRIMGSHYAELTRAEALITETLKLEETRFKQMLDRGLRLLEDEIGKLGAKDALPGAVAFKLYDTYGFPLDLTQDVLRGQGRSVDTAGFERAMEEQRAAARKAWAGSGERAEEQIWFELRDRLGATEFLGYSEEKAEGVVRAIVIGGREAKEAVPDSDVALLANQTPFYAEAGGQVGDTGVIRAASGATIQVRDTVKRADSLHVHLGKVVTGTLKAGDAVELEIDHARRTRIRANHSVTHLAHEALRRVLGPHVTQKGSLVGPERMRFDFSHTKAMSAEEIARVENEVNALIRGNGEVSTRLMTPSEAVTAGALALFGEKYGEEVRVIAMGAEPASAAAGSTAKPFFSTELCGGTHVRRTGDIGLFKIVGESAVGAGVRRIEVVTGPAAEAYIAEGERTLKAAAAALKTAPADLPARIEALLEERRKLERELAEARRALAMGGGARSGGDEAKSINGVKYIGRTLADVPARDLKPLADELKKKVGSGVVAVISSAEGKASIVVGVTDDLTKRISAVDLVRIGSAALGGQGGGGRPDMAQAGGPDPAKAEAALAEIEKALAQKLAA